VTAAELPDVGNVVPLFDVAEVVAPARPGEVGRAERGLRRALEAGAVSGVLREEDLGMIGAALVAARALDDAERWAGSKGGGPYAVAAVLTPYREVLQALRLPAATVPEEAGSAPVPPDGQGGTPSWLGDAFGTPE
jgi:hypothetical protein